MPTRRFVLTLIAAALFTAGHAHASYQIFIKIAGRSTLTLDMESSDSIENIKTKVQGLIGYAPDQMAPFYGSQELHDGSTLADYGITPETIVNIYPSTISPYYDGFADFPTYPLSLISFFNTLAGMIYIHTAAFSGTFDTSAVTLEEPVTLSLQTTTFGVPVALENFDPAANHSWSIVTAAGGILGYTPGSFDVDLTGFLNAPTPAQGSFSVALSGDSKSLNLVYNAVPEPSAYAAGIAALLGGTILLRRRRHAAL